MWAERALGPILEKQRASLARASGIACKDGRNAHPGRAAMRATGQLARSSARSRHERTPPSPRTPGSSFGPFLHARPEPARRRSERRPPAGKRQDVRELIYTNFARPRGARSTQKRTQAAYRKARGSTGARSGRFRTPGGSLAHLTSVQRWPERILGPVPEKQRASLARASGIACKDGRNAHRRRRGMRASGQLARASAGSGHERTPPSPRTPGARSGRFCTPPGARSTRERALHHQTKGAEGPKGSLETFLHVRRLALDRIVRRPPAGMGGNELEARSSQLCTSIGSKRNDAERRVNGQVPRAGGSAKLLG